MTAGLEKTWGLNSADALMRYDVSLTTYLATPAVDEKNIGKCWTRPVDQALKNKKKRCVRIRSYFLRGGGGTVDRIMEKYAKLSLKKEKR